MSAGSFFLIKQRRPPAQRANIAAGKKLPGGEFYPEWRIYLRFPGRSPQMINSGMDLCAKCLASEQPGKLRADCQCRVKPSRAARLQLESYNDQRMGLTGAEGVRIVRMRRDVASVGQVAAAYLSPGVRILKSETQARRNVNDLRNVLAYALNLWTTAGQGRRGIRPGTRVADTEKIDALALSVLTADLVRRYYAARSEGGVVDYNEPQEDNVTINSMLAHARDVFSRNARAHKLGDLKLPDLSGFLEFPSLPQESAAADPLPPAAFEAMVAGREKLPAELRLVNMLLTRTGLRSSYVLALTGEWLREDGGTVYLDVRNREGFRKKRGTRDQLIPLDAELAGLLLARKDKRWLVMPDGSDGARHDLVHQTHNAWLKGLIGGAGERTQGNHRLRDTVASVLWTLDKPSAAQEALGHSSVETTAKHYARKALVCPAMRAELAAWL